MPFVQAKCPMCGGMLAVDDTKKAAVCQFCEAAFVVEEAVNNYITNNITNNTINNNIGDGAVVNVIEQSKSIPALLERIVQFLEDKDWDTANQYCEEVLDIEPQNAQAYLGKLMAELQVSKKPDLVKHKGFGNSVNYQRILKYGDKVLQNELSGYLSEANNKNRNQGKLQKYQESEEQYQDACKIWEKQVAAIKQACKEKAEAKLSVEREALLSDIESKYSAMTNELSQQLRTLEQKKSESETTLKTLGFFAFSKKKNAKEHISELVIQIENINQQLSTAKQTLRQEKDSLVSWAKNRKEQLLSEMACEHPLPPQPERTPIVLDDGTTLTFKQLQLDCTIDFVLDAMEPGSLYERSDIETIINEFEETSWQRAAAITNSMVSRGYLEKMVISGVECFKLR
jgi:uncharacterized protein YbaR (Trm112 family)